MNKDITSTQDIEKRLAEIKEVSPQDKSTFGKYLADSFFSQQGWTSKWGKKSDNIIASDGKENYLVDVRFGRKFQITMKNIEKLSSIEGAVPAFLFISPEKKFVFLVPKEINKVDNNGRKTEKEGSEM